MENSQYGLPTIGACQFNAAFFPYQVPITDLIQYPYAFLCGVDLQTRRKCSQIYWIIKQGLPSPLYRTIPRSHYYYGLYPSWNLTSLDQRANYVNREFELDLNSTTKSLIPI